jgi:hypothetical protein
MLMRMKAATALAAALLLGACGPAPRSQQADPTKETWYAQGVKDLSSMMRDAEIAFKSGKGDEAAALITKGQPIMDRLVSVPHPTREALEAASDLDDLYGRMLLSNRHYGWARMEFQKNFARWRHWTPQTPETQRRLKQAEEEIAECDRHIE